MSDTAAVIYARVSSEQQDANFSIPSQIDAAKEYAQRRGMRVLKVFHEDASGFIYPRPVLEQALELIEAGEAQALIVHDGDRLNRDHVNGHLIRVRLAKAKAELHYTLSGPCNLEDHLILMIRDAISADEARRIKERMMRGKTHKAKGGAFPGGLVPYGYRVVGEREDMHLEINEEQAQWVRKIFEWYLEGIGIPGIMRRFEAAGIQRPAVGKRTTKLPPCRWSPATIYHILKSETYIGTYYYNKRTWHRGKSQTHTLNNENAWIKITVPAIVDEVTFAKTRQRLAEGQQKSKRNRLRTYLLAGMLRCGHCGAGMTTYPGKSYMYYRCASYKVRVGIEQSCPIRFPRMEQVDAAVWQCVVSLVRDPELLRESVAAAQKEAMRDNQQLYVALADIESAIESNKRRLARAIQLFVDSEDDDTRQIAKQQRVDIESVLSNLHRERVRYSQQILSIQISDESLTAVEEFCRDISNDLDILSIEQRRTFLQKLGVTGVMHMEDKQRVIYLNILLTTHRVAVDTAFGATSNIKDSIDVIIPLTFRIVIAA